METNVITSEQVAPTVQTVLGADLNYSPFSSWYGKVKETLESSEFITEALFMQALEHIGAISRNGSQTLPPRDIYEIMRGINGKTKSGWYCKKDSTITGRHVESYGICLDEIESFESKYLTPVIRLLTAIELGIQSEAEEAEDYRISKKETARRDQYRRITAKSKRMFEAGKEFVIKDAFRVLDEESK